MSELSPTNEWSELRAAQRSEAELKQIMQEGAPRATSRALDLAHADALKAMVCGLPDPAEVAATMMSVHPGAANTLMRAWISRSQPYAGAWRVENNEHVAVLRSCGLVGWVGANRDDGCAVGNFGNEVRKFMLCEHPSQAEGV